MTDRISDSSALEDAGLTPEEQRLGDLFECADRLADDHAAQEAFLQSLTASDRQEIVSALVHANALRLMGRDRTATMQGHAQRRLQEAMQAKADGRSGPADAHAADWSVTDSVSSETP